MQIHHLRALMAIVDTKSFTAAARQLRMSQSSLSHAIAGLEKELRVKLLERGRQGARPTEVGQRVLVRARQVLDGLDSICAEADNTAGELSGRIRVGSIPSATVAFLPKVMARFGQQHPGVEVVLLEEPSQGTQQLTAWLRDGTLDVAILELPANEMKTLPLMKDELCALVPAKSPLAKRTKISVRELAREPFVMSRYTSERLVFAAYARRGPLPKIRFEVQDLATLINIVREGLGVSIIPRLAVSSAPAGTALISVAPRIVREIGCGVKFLDQMSPAVRAFLRNAAELARSRGRSA